MNFILGMLGSMPGAISQGLVWGLMAIGVYITFKILDIADLTVDGSICTGAAVCAVLTINGVPVGLSMCCAFLAGMLTGIVTGLFHTKLGIPPILSGILTQLILWSVNLKIMGKANVSVSSRTYEVLLSSMDNTWAIIILAIFGIALIVALYWFFGTEFGCSLRSTGCNLAMSRAQGINTNYTTVVGLALSNGIVALSGALLAQYQGFADINMGRVAIVIGLAAVIIGEAVFSFAKNFALRLLGVLVGGIIYYVVYQVVIYLGLDTDLLKMLSALVVGLFLGIPYLKKRYLRRPKRKGVKTNAGN